jgi:hypothetical protein
MIRSSEKLTTCNITSRHSSEDNNRQNSRITRFIELYFGEMTLILHDKSVFGLRSKSLG